MGQMKPSPLLAVGTNTFLRAAHILNLTTISSLSAALRSTYNAFSNEWWALSTGNIAFWFGTLQITKMAAYIWNYSQPNRKCVSFNIRWRGSKSNQFHKLSFLSWDSTLTQILEPQYIWPGWWWWWFCTFLCAPPPTLQCLGKCHKEKASPCEKVARWPNLDPSWGLACKGTPCFTCKQTFSSSLFLRSWAERA